MASRLGHRLAVRCGRCARCRRATRALQDPDEVIDEIEAALLKVAASIMQARASVCAWLARQRAGPLPQRPCGITLWRQAVRAVRATHWGSLRLALGSSGHTLGQFAPCIRELWRAVGTGTAGWPELASVCVCLGCWLWRWAQEQGFEYDVPSRTKTNQVCACTAGWGAAVAGQQGLAASKSCHEPRPVRTAPVTRHGC